MIQLSGQLLSKPGQLTAGRLQELAHLGQHIQLFSRKMLQHQMQQLQHHETVIRLMSPTALLQKGFALVYARGNLITSAAGLEAGDQITVQMADAAVHATIHSKTKSGDGDESNI